MTVTLNEYREYILGLINPNIPKTQLLLYLSGKLANESTELLETDSYDDFIEELGDVGWYLINLYNYYNIDFNIESVVEYKLAYKHCVRDLVVSTGRLSGEILKRDFHTKVVSPKTIIDMMSVCKNSWTNCIFNSNIPDQYQSVEYIINSNYEKLSKRHGTSYDSQFYTSGN